MNKDLIFESFRNCISEKKCKGCNWKICKIVHNRKVGVPVDLALAVTSLMAELLKNEPEPVKPVRGGYQNRMWECGVCNSPLGIVGDDVRDNYCRKCGRKVNWNG